MINTTPNLELCYCKKCVHNKHQFFKQPVLLMRPGIGRNLRYCLRSSTCCTWIPKSQKWSQHPPNVFSYKVKVMVHCFLPPLHLEGLIEPLPCVINTTNASIVQQLLANEAFVMLLDSFLYPSHRKPCRHWFHTASIQGWFSLISGHGFTGLRGIFCNY